jgi:predicted amidohydrolase
MYQPGFAVYITLGVETTMRPTILAAAQSASVPKDVRTNLAQHLIFARLAAEHSVSLLLFPELSLTGYELAFLAAGIVDPEDAVLFPIRDLSQQANMTVVIGAPVASEASSKPSIGAICFHPDGTLSTYRKRILHAGEEEFAVAGTVNAHVLNSNGQHVSLAICADTGSYEHPRWAKDAGATVYAAGVLWGESGYEADASLVKAHCVRHGFAGLVANHARPTGGFQSAGRSAFWTPSGKLLCTAPPDKLALLVATGAGNDWACNCTTIDA